MTAQPSPRAQVVRREVSALLLRSRAFQALPPDARARLTEDMVRVGDYLAEPLGTAPGARSLAQDAVDSLKQRLADKPGETGAEFRAGAGREGVEQFGQLVRTVDFPAFVGGLVKGVFNAVVDASIQQMQAYGELLAAVSKTVEQFANDEISDAQARDHVHGRFPSATRIDTSGDGPARLRPAEGDAGNVDLGKEFKLPDAVSLDDDEGEQTLVNAAKLEMARQRQQLLSTMVLLGINRIVVTDGHINAKVVFDMRADDQAGRHAKAQMSDEAKHESKTSFSVSGWGAAFDTSSKSSHVATVSSAIDDTSESKAQLKATLSGDVRLAFKSETFPLERLVDSAGMATLNDRAQPGTAGSPAPALPTAPAKGDAR